MGAVKATVMSVGMTRWTEPMKPARGFHQIQKTWLTGVSASEHRQLPGDLARIGSGLDDALPAVGDLVVE